jgi:hypothetical protein
MANIQKDAHDTYTREDLMRVREEEAKRWRARSAAKAAESSKRRKLRP